MAPLKDATLKLVFRSWQKTWQQSRHRLVSLKQQKCILYSTLEQQNSIIHRALFWILIDTVLGK